ncbi:MAG: 30S ribosome-binding factor RbfA [Bacteroidota bacterium]|jgi:ribosome-binding factor A
MGLRQDKFAKLIQRDLGELFTINKSWTGGAFITISEVNVSPDLGYVKVYLSLFNNPNRSAIMTMLEENNKAIRHSLAQRLKNQVRKIPEIVFFEDDTMDHVVKIEKLFDSLNNKDKKDQ